MFRRKRRQRSTSLPNRIITRERVEFGKQETLTSCSRGAPPLCSHRAGSPLAADSLAFRWPTSPAVRGERRRKMFQGLQPGVKKEKPDRSKKSSRLNRTQRTNRDHETACCDQGREAARAARVHHEAAVPHQLFGLSGRSWAFAQPPARACVQQIKPRPPTRSQPRSSPRYKMEGKLFRRSSFALPPPDPVFTLSKHTACFCSLSRPLPCSSCAQNP